MAGGELTFKNHGGVHQQKEYTGRKVKNELTGKVEDEFKLVNYPMGSIIKSDIDLEKRFGGKFEYLSGDRSNAKEPAAEAYEASAAPGGQVASGFQATDGETSGPISEFGDDAEAILAKAAEIQRRRDEAKAKAAAEFASGQSQPPKQPDSDFDRMSLQELKTFATENKIDLKQAAKREDVLAAVKKHTGK